MLSHPAFGEGLPETAFRLIVNALDEPVYVYEPLFQGEQIVDLRIVGLNRASRAASYGRIIRLGDLASEVFVDNEMALLAANEAWHAGVASPYRLERDYELEQWAEHYIYDIATLRVGHLLAQVCTDRTVEVVGARSEEVLRSMLDTVEASVVALRPVVRHGEVIDATTEWANFAARRVWGDAVIGRSALTFAQPQEFLALAQQAWNEGSATRTLEQSKYPGAAWSAASQTIHRFGDRLLEFTVDVSFEYQLLGASEARERLLRTVVEGTGEGIALHEPKFDGDQVTGLRVAFANPMYGALNPGARPSELLTPLAANAGVVFESARTAWLSGEPASCTLRSDTAEVPWDRLEVTFHRVGDRLLEVQRDLTAQDRMEMRRSQILDALSEAVFVVEPVRVGGESIADAEIVYANGRARSLFVGGSEVDGSVPTRFGQLPLAGLDVATGLSSAADLGVVTTQAGHHVDGGDADSFRVVDVTYGPGPDGTVLVVVNDRSEVVDALQDARHHQELLSAVLDTLTEAVVVVDEQLDVVLHNRAAGSIVNVAGSEAHALPDGLRRALSVAADDASGAEPGLEDSVRLVHLEGPRADSAVRTLTMSAAGLPSEPGVRVVGLHDVTDLLAAEAELRRSLVLQDEAMRHLHDTVLVWRQASSGDFEVEYANPAGQVWLAAPCPARLDDLLLDEVTLGDLRRRLRTVAGTEQVVVQQMTLLESDAPSRIQAVRATHSPLPGGGILTVMVDLSAEAREAAELRERTLRDPETGKWNRVGFELEVTRLASEPNVRLAVTVIELDQLEVVERSLGPAVASALVAIALARTEELAPPAAIIGRLSASTLAVGVELPAVTAVDDAETLAAAIVRQIALPAVVGGAPLHLGSTAGLAFAPLHGTDPHDLTTRARLAALEARAVRSPVATWHPGIEEQGAHRAELLADIARGLAAEEFIVFFQPKYTPEGELVGAEALARWEHPERGLLAPGGFIEIVEQSTLAQPFTAHILRTALRDWQHVGAPGRVAVNVPAAMASDPKLVDLVTAALVATGCAGNRIAIEFTERGLVASDRVVTENFSRLRAMGVRISIDDFGTGNASLAYLRTLRVDEVKIDRAFITNIDADVVNQAVVAAVVHMASALGLLVVAEGVETEAELAMAWRSGCHFAQGYLLARPMPVEAMLRLAEAAAGTFVDVKE